MMQDEIETSGAFDPEAATRAYIDGLGPEALQQAAAYTLGNHWIAVAGLFISGLVAWLVLRTGLLQVVERRFGARSSIGVFVIGVVYTVLSTVISLPWTVYADWIRERRFDMTDQPLADYLGQSAISLGVSAVMAPIFFVLLYVLIRVAGRIWWLWSGGLVAAFAATALLLAPVYIEPLFNTYEPLPEGVVRDALEGMAADAGIPADRIFVYDGSRQSNNFTANVAGLGAAKRIAISDVALGDASLDEVKAVTGHEIGHYVLGHVWRMVGVASALAVGLFFLSDRTFGLFARGFGTSPTIADPSGLPVLMFAAGLFGFLAQPALNATIRIGETEADKYSLQTVNLPDGLASALVKTAEYRDPRPARWQELIFYTHPTVESRVRRAMEWKAAHPPGDL